MSSSKSRLLAGLGAALLIAACGDLPIVPPPPPPPAPPGSYTLTLSSPTLSIVQGGGTTTVNVTLVRTNFTRPVTLAVDIGNFHGTMPPGVAVAAWTPNPVTGNSSVLTLTVDTAAVPGVYDLIVYGIEEPAPGVFGFAWFTLTIVPLTVTVPSISLLLSSGSAHVWQGNSTQLVATLTRAGGFTGSVDVTVTGAPSGVTATVYSGQTSGAVTTSYVSLSVDATTVPGVYPLVFHATGNGVSEATATFTLTTTVPGFTLTLSSPTLSIVQGAASPTTTVNVVRNDFVGPVELSVGWYDEDHDVLPPGVTAAFAPNPATGNSAVLTLTVGAAATPGVHHLFVFAGASTGGFCCIPLTLTVTAPLAPGYTLTTTAPRLSVAQGASASITTVDLARNNFTGNVTLSVENLPTGVRASFSPYTQISGNSAELWVSVAPHALPGTYTNLLVRGVASGLADQTAPLTLTITLAPFVLTLSSPTLSIVQGAATKTTMVNVVRNNFTGPVSLFVNDDGEGTLDELTAEFAPNPTTGDSSVLSLTVGAAMVPGVYVLSIYGRASTGEFGPVWLTLTVTAASP